MQNRRVESEEQQSAIHNFALGVQSWGELADLEQYREAKAKIIQPIMGSPTGLHYFLTLHVGHHSQDCRIKQTREQWSSHSSLETEYLLNSGHLLGGTAHE